MEEKKLEIEVEGEESAREKREDAERSGKRKKNYNLEASNPCLLSSACRQPRVTVDSSN